MPSSLLDPSPGESTPARDCLPHQVDESRNRMLPRKRIRLTPYPAHVGQLADSPHVGSERSVGYVNAGFTRFLLFEASVRAEPQPASSDIETECPGILRCTWTKWSQGDTDAMKLLGGAEFVADHAVAPRTVGAFCSRRRCCGTPVVDTRGDAASYLVVPACPLDRDPLAGSIPGSTHGSRNRVWLLAIPRPAVLRPSC